MLISGSIDPATGRAALHPVFSIGVPARTSDPGDYAIDLIDMRDRVVATYSFAPLHAQPDRFGSGSDREIISFHLALPDRDDVALLRVRQGAAVIGELNAGQHTGPAIGESSAQRPSPITSGHLVGQRRGRRPAALPGTRLDRRRHHLANHRRRFGSTTHRSQRV